MDCRAERIVCILTHALAVIESTTRLFFYLCMYLLHIYLPYSYMFISNWGTSLFICFSTSLLLYLPALGVGKTVKYD